jgi:phospholipase C
MSIRRLLTRSSHYLYIGLTFFAALNYTLAAPLLSAADAAANPDNDTRTPIKHVIVIIGENRTFDHVFATYQPKVPGETVDNLLSKRIINPDGTPGPNYSFALQLQACDPGTGYGCQPPTGLYQNSPQARSVMSKLPAPLAGGPTNVCTDNSNCNSAFENKCMCSLKDATTSEDGLAAGYYQYLLTGGTGLAHATPDTRIKDVQ